MKIKAPIEENMLHALGTDRLTRREKRARMKKIHLWAWALLFGAIFLLQLGQASAQTFPNVTWSNQEITIPGNGDKQLIDTTLTSSSFAAGWHTCIVTFSTELATSEGLQLAALEYSRGSNPTVSMCQGYPGPVITQVSGGVDEAHTFVSPFQFYVHQANAPYTFKIRPCMSSGLGGSYRLARHSMTLQCK